MRDDLEGRSRPQEATLARFAAELAEGDLPEAVRTEGRRSLVNIFATALAGCREAPVEAILRAGAPFSGSADCTVIGRPERVDAMLASCVNAAAANIFDFDDTHEATIIHPAAIVFAAVFAHAERIPVAGRDLLRAFVLGCEVECRIGNAVTPGHYARGWHITSTCGIFGAAAATGHLLRLDEARMLDAFANAAAQSAGLVEMLGTGAKSVGVGGAARNGYMAALLAAEGCGGSDRPLSAPLGFLNVYAERPRPAALTDGLGQAWEFAATTYKPYPVGVVLNPVIEAVLDLRATEGLPLDHIARITLTGHPLLRERTDRPHVATGRATQVSAQHAIAICLLEGRAGLEEFSDAAAARTATIRPEVSFRDDADRPIASARVEVTLATGATLTREVTAAAGSRERPLSDTQLEEKLRQAARGVAFDGDTDALIDALWSIDQAPDAGAVIRLAAS